MQKHKKGRDFLQAQRPSWALKGEVPSPSFSESHTIQSPEPLATLFLNK